MRNTITAIVIACLVAAILISAFFYITANINQNELKQELKELQTRIAAVENEFKEKTAPNGVSTPDEIAAMERELNENKNATQTARKNTEQTILQYIDILYNTEGDFFNNKDKILKALEGYVAPSFMQTNLPKMFENNRYANPQLVNKKSKISNLCTEDDIYLTVEEYYDGSDTFIAVCELHFEDNIQYHTITAADYGGKILINSDTLLTARMVGSGG